MAINQTKRLLAIFKSYFSFNELKQVVVFIWPFIWKQKFSYLGLLLLLFIDVILTLSFAWFFGHIAGAAIHSNLSQIKELVPIGILLTCLSIATNFSNLMLETVTLNGLKKELKNKLYHHILRLPAEQTMHRHSGEWLSVFTTDVHSIDGLVGSNLINLIRLPIIYLSVLIYLFHLNIVLTLMCLSIAPFVTIIGVIFGLILKRNSHAVLDLFSKMNSLLNDSFQGLTIIRSFTLEKHFYSKFKSQNNEIYQLERQQARIQGWFRAGGQLISTGLFLSTLSIGAFFVSEKAMTVSVLLTFISLINHLIYPLTGLAGQWAEFQRSIAAAERLGEVLQKSPVIHQLPNFTHTTISSPSIDFDHITFSYNGKTTVFKDFNFHIPSGKTIALVGPSGAGKTTLLNLLLGFYQPQKGKISLDQRSLDTYSISEYRSSIAYVPQETQLFSGTVRENLLIAKPGLQDEEIIQAAKRSRLHDFILTLPNGYDTFIGEKGASLSGGQKQRLAIARAILKDAPVLILDEATSALDTETEFLVKNALDELMKGRTTLIIAHRLSTIQQADQIAVLEKGKLVQLGTHDELIHQEGLYRSLYDPHFLSNEEIVEKGALLGEKPVNVTAI